MFIFSLKESSGFKMTVEKPKPKQLLRPITTGAGMQRDEPITIPTNYM